MYREGTVAEVDIDRCRARVRFGERSITSPWLSVLQTNTHSNQDYALPDVGEFVAVMLDEREEHGCILGALYTAKNVPPSPSQDVRRVTFGDDAIVEYDRAAKKLTIVTTGVVDVQAGSVVVSDSLKIAGGASELGRADLIAAALSTFKDAIANAIPVPQDGGVGLQTTIMTALAGFPPNIKASKVTSD